MYLSEDGDADNEGFPQRRASYYSLHHVYLDFGRSSWYEGYVMITYTKSGDDEVAS